MSNNFSSGDLSDSVLRAIYANLSPFDTLASGKVHEWWRQQYKKSDRGCVCVSDSVARFYQLRIDPPERRVYVCQLISQPKFWNLLQYDHYDNLRELVIRCGAISFSLNLLNRYRYLTRLEISAEVGVPRHTARPLKVRLNFPDLRRFVFRRYDDSNLILTAPHLQFLGLITLNHQGSTAFHYRQCVTELAVDWPVESADMFLNVETLHVDRVQLLSDDLFRSLPRLRRVYLEEFNGKTEQPDVLVEVLHL